MLKVFWQNISNFMKITRSVLLFLARHLLYPFCSSFDTLLKLREIDIVRSSRGFWSNRRKRLWSGGELRKNEVYTSKMMKRRYVVIIYEGKYHIQVVYLGLLSQRLIKKEVMHRDCMSFKITLNLSP